MRRRRDLVVFHAEPGEFERKRDDRILLVRGEGFPRVVDNRSHATVEGVGFALDEHLRQAPRRRPRVAGTFQLERIGNGLRRVRQGCRRDRQVAECADGQGPTLRALAVRLVAIGRNPIPVVGLAFNSRVEEVCDDRGANKHRRSPFPVPRSPVDAVFGRVTDGAPRKRNALGRLCALCRGDGRFRRAGDDATLIATVIDLAVLDARRAGEINDVRAGNLVDVLAGVDGGRTGDKPVVAVRRVQEQRVAADEVRLHHNFRVDAGRKGKCPAFANIIVAVGRAAFFRPVAVDDAVDEIAAVRAARSVAGGPVIHDGGIVDAALVESAHIARIVRGIRIRVVRDERADHRRLVHAAHVGSVGDAVRDDAVHDRAAVDAARVGRGVSVDDGDALQRHVLPELHACRASGTVDERLVRPRAEDRQRPVVVAVVGRGRKVEALVDARREADVLAVEDTPGGGGDGRQRIRLRAVVGVVAGIGGHIDVSYLEERLDLDVAGDVFDGERRRFRSRHDDAIRCPADECAVGDSSRGDSDGTARVNELDGGGDGTAYGVAEAVDDKPLNPLVLVRARVVRRIVRETRRTGTETEVVFRRADEDGLRLIVARTVRCHRRD